MARRQHRPAQYPPVTSHRLFPAATAIWFAGLFGLGCMALRPSLLDALIIRNRIDLVLAAVTPPLGIGTRLLIALALAALGGMIGAGLARLIARPHREPGHPGPGSDVPARAPARDHRADHTPQILDIARISLTEPGPEPAPPPPAGSSADPVVIFADQAAHGWPTQTGSARMDDSPFPTGKTAGIPDATEQALRRVLANLRQVSGAA